MSMSRKHTLRYSDKAFRLKYGRPYVWAMALLGAAVWAGVCGCMCFYDTKWYFPICAGTLADTLALFPLSVSLYLLAKRQCQAQRQWIDMGGRLHVRVVLDDVADSLMTAAIRSYVCMRVDRIETRNRHFVIYGDIRVEDSVNGGSVKRRMTRMRLRRCFDHEDLILDMPRKVQTNCAEI